MRRVQPLAWAVLLAAAALLWAAPAGAAPQPVHLGQAASSSTVETATGAGGCECTVAQFHDVGPTSASYAIPFDGVVVASGFYIGNSVESADTVQVQTVHRTGTAAGTVVSEGAIHGIFGLPKKAVSSFYDRLPAHAGDVLAARFHASPLLEATPYFFKAAVGDEAAKSAATAAGSSLSGIGAPIAERRLNLEAVLEPDEDADGYGDSSQDLCPGSPIAATACSGTLFGSNLQGERTTPPLPCGGGGCLKVQTQVDGVSTAAPFDGVVVRWRVLNAEAGTYRARVLEFNPAGSGGMFRSYHVLHSSAAEAVTAPSQPLFSKISSFPARLPISAGSYVGLSFPSLSDIAFQGSGGAATYSETNDGGDGTTVSGTTKNGTLLYDADIEPDVDADGYGDVTQDSCPSAATIHEGACPSSPGGGTGGGGGSAQPSGAAAPGPQIGPRIAALAVKPKSFRAKPLGGAAARGSWGTKLKLHLSVAGRVKLTIETRKGGLLQTLTKQLGAGSASIPYNGQYRRHGKLLDLPPGSYRLTARAENAAGTGPSARATFTVLPPRG